MSCPKCNSEYYNPVYPDELEAPSDRKCVDCDEVYHVCKWKPQLPTEAHGIDSKEGTTAQQSLGPITASERLVYNDLRRDYDITIKVSGEQMKDLHDLAWKDISHVEVVDAGIWFLKQKLGLL